MDGFNPVEVFSQRTQKIISGVSEVASKSIDDIIKAQEAADKSHKLHSMLSSWAIQQTQERKLRKLYAICFIVFLGMQIVALVTAFFLIGIGIITISETQFNIFFVSVFGEITALVLIITNYLFPKNYNIKSLEMMKDL